MIELARQYGRYGYPLAGRRLQSNLPRGVGLLPCRDTEDGLINDKRVKRLWRREGLKVPMKQPKKGRLWQNDGSSVGLRPESRNHVGSYDCVQHQD
jgi:hypothetical protein